MAGVEASMTGIMLFSHIWAVLTCTPEHGAAMVAKRVLRKGCAKKSGLHVFDVHRMK